MKRLTIAIAVIAIIVVVLLVWKVDRGSPTAGSSSGGSSTSDPKPQTPNPKPKSALAERERSPLADALNSPATDIRADLRLLSDIVTTFRTNFPREGNPVGANAEITATLTGRNKLNLSLIPPDHPAINARGELCDRWGTPFFFHAESGAKMEIRSAGPDRKMWTADDTVHSP